MARSNRRGDRVDFNANRAGELFSRSSGTLPSTSYRVSRLMSYDEPLLAVIPSLRRDAERMPAIRLPISRPAERAFRRDVQRALLRNVSFTTAELPSRVLFCIRRKQRREALFAFKRAGYSGSVKKRSFRRVSSSKYGC